MREIEWGMVMKQGAGLSWMGSPQVIKDISTTANVYPRRDKMVMFLESPDSILLEEN